MHFFSKFIDCLESIYENRHFKWFIMELLCVRYLYEKIKPPPVSITSSPDYRSPTSILIWCFGIYVALFGLASQKYESRVDVVENRSNAIITQLANSEMQNQAINQVSKAQNLYVPVQPSFLRIDKVISAFFLKPSQFHEDTVSLLKDSLVSFKKHKVGKKYIQTNRS